MPSVDKHAEQLEISYIVGRNVKWYNQFETVRQFLIKVSIHLIYNPVIPYLSFY